MAASSNSWKGSRSASPRDSTFAARVVGVAWLIVGLRGGRAWILFAPNPCPTRGRLLSISLRPHRLREIRVPFVPEGDLGRSPISAQKLSVRGIFVQATANSDQPVEAS